MGGLKMKSRSLFHRKLERHPVDSSKKTIALVQAKKNLWRDTTQQIWDYFQI